MTSISAQQERRLDLFPRGLNGGNSPHSNERAVRHNIEHGAAKHTHASSCNTKHVERIRAGAMLAGYQDVNRRGILFLLVVSREHDNLGCGH